MKDYEQHLKQQATKNKQQKTKNAQRQPTQL
jgi:hypothetical protein